MFRLTPIHLMILDCVKETLLSQLGLIVSRAITVTAQARSHLLLSGILVNGNEALVFTIGHPRGFSTSFDRFLFRGDVRETHTHHS